MRDEFSGMHSFDVQNEVGDFLIGRHDGTPSYQLAVVVDDAAQGVTEVLRGDDLLSSAARQQLLQRTLGLVSPRWFHVPLVTDTSGRRLAKRADDLSLASLREGGTDPRAIVAWVARSAGMRAGDRTTAHECTTKFSIDRVSRDPVRLDSTTVASLRDAR